MSRLNSSDVKTKYEGLISLEGVLGFSIYTYSASGQEYNSARGQEYYIYGGKNSAVRNTIIVAQHRGAALYIGSYNRQLLITALGNWGGKISPPRG